jgi:hypothetical protein
MLEDLEIRHVSQGEKRWHRCGQSTELERQIGTGVANDDATEVLPAGLLQSAIDGPTEATYQSVYQLQP